jgi:hypothetical protein
MDSAFYYVKKYECHQCNDGFCKIEVHSSDKNFDVTPKDCIHATIQKSLNIDIIPIWVKVDVV